MILYKFEYLAHHEILFNNNVHWLWRTHNDDKNILTQWYTHTHNDTHSITDTDTLTYIDSHIPTHIITDKITHKKNYTRSYIHWRKYRHHYDYTYIYLHIHLYSDLYTITRVINFDVINFSYIIQFFILMICVFYNSEFFVTE